MKKICLIAVVLLLAVEVSGQHSSLAYRKLADSLFRFHHYQDAAHYYAMAIRKSTEPGNVMVMVGRSYGRMNNPGEAHKWFEKAKQNQATFSDTDTYEYVEVLMMQQNRKEAERVLLEVLKDDPNDLLARETLDDIVNYRKYYKDSLSYQVTPLSINTPESEFAPAYYKNGIVYSSAQREKFSRKKYHWDNSNYLNLYVSQKEGNVFQKPVLFERELNTKFHDGPATFYADYDRMIVNRNQAVKQEGSDNSYIWHLALFDAQQSGTGENASWLVTRLPFDQPPYSFAHPAITEDGNVLYFVSDIPGGYGGTDIYRVIKKNGIWSQPFNLGPAVNTPENEVFPFLVNNTLYFASDGHGGMGGLDVFKSQQTLNGFGPAINLGYPINSPTDDFSFITSADQQTGYFASARAGNDDLYSFEHVIEKVQMLAHIYDAVTNEPLAGASIQMMTSSGSDISLTSDAKGDIAFELPSETMFMLIGNKEGKVGMVIGSAIQQEDKIHMTHQIAALGDTTRVACVGMIKNALGVSEQASSITIIDKTTGKKMDHGQNLAAVSFLGEKDHVYSIEIQNQNGDTTVHEVKIKTDEKGAVTWNMTLKDALMTLAARVVRADNNQPLGGASVKVTTFSEADLDLVANEEGLVEFQIPKDAAYILIGSKNELTGMHSGIAETGADKSSVIHIIPAKGDPLHPVSVAALITDKSGQIITDATAVVTDRATGETVPAKIENGVLTFVAERDKNYNINVESGGHQTTLEEIHIATDANAVEKISLMLLDKPVVMHTLTAKVFKASDNTPLGSAQVKILNFSEPDVELVANEQGTVNFSLAEGETFVVIGSKDGYTGMYSGLIESSVAGNSVVLVPAHNDPINHVPIVGRIADSKGNLITEAIVTVTDKASGKNIPVKFENGMLTFLGDKGKDYVITVSDKDHQSATQAISIPKEAVDTEKIAIVMEDNPVIPEAKQVTVVAHLTDREGKLITLPEITVTDSLTGEKINSSVDKGVVKFNGEKGKTYSVTSTDTSKKSTVRQITIPQDASSVNEMAIVLGSNKAQSSSPATIVTANITGKQGVALKDAKVVVIDKVSGKTIPSEVKGGVLSFAGEPGKTYAVTVDHPGFKTASNDLAVQANSPAVDKNTIALESSQVTTPVTAMITTRSSNKLTNAIIVATDKSTGQQIPVNMNGGIASFTGDAGREYTVSVESSGQQTVSQQVQIPANASSGDEISVVLDDHTAVAAITAGTAQISGITSSNGQSDLTGNSVSASSGSSSSSLVTGHVMDDRGNYLGNARVTVTDKNTGEPIPATLENGILAFTGKKGNTYTVKVEHDAHKTGTREITLPADGGTEESISVTLEKLPVMFSMAARVFKASDNTPLGGASVKILNFSENDIELAANDEGIVDFSLMEGETFIIIVSKDGFSGMFTATVEKGMDKATIIHPVPAHPDTEKELPVMVKLSDDTGASLEHAQVEVTEKSSGKIMDAIVLDGILSFSGEKGKSYTVEVNANGYESHQQEIQVDALTSAVKATEIVLGSPEVNLPSAANLVILNAGGPNARAYISTQGSLSEVQEKDGILYLVQDGASISLGKGNLNQLKHDPRMFADRLHLTSNSVVAIGNIYFDFNSTQLDEADKRELNKVKELIAQHPAVSLKVGTHADDRGREAYNLNLSRKRAKAVESYLESSGVASDHIDVAAYGESVPLVQCESKECTEDEHKRNRRAEFELSMTNPVPLKQVVAAHPEEPRTELTYEEMLERYGNVKKDGLYFKIAVGAYRFNQSLTFDQLKDLGIVESTLEDGVTYYFLSGVSTLREAHDMRLKVIERGVGDAAITIFYQGEKISIQTFRSLMK